MFTVWAAGYDLLRFYHPTLYLPNSKSRGILRSGFGVQAEGTREALQSVSLDDIRRDIRWH